MTAGAAPARAGRLRRGLAWAGVAVAVAVVVAATAVVLLPVVDPFGTQFEDVEPAVPYVAAEPAPPPAEAPDRLEVMTWNVKFGGGRLDFFFDCHGDRVLMTREEVLGHLEGLAAKIRQVDPDVLLLQEVDVHAARSADVDQVQWLLDHTGLSYGVYASQWRAGWIPSRGLGHMDSGNAILSRWPLEAGRRVALAPMKEYDPVTRYFYLKRNLLEARLALPGRDGVWVVTTHAEAYSKGPTKRRHVEAFLAALDAHDRSGHTLLAGGDLNTIPPGSARTHDFPDSACTGTFEADDYRREAGWLDGLYARFRAAVPLEVYAADNGPHLTHTTDGRGSWNRTLDYLFTNTAFAPGSALTHQGEASGGVATMPLSDHAPVTATWLLDAPRPPPPAAP